MINCINARFSRNAGKRLIEIVERGNVREKMSKKFRKKLKTRITFSVVPIFLTNC